MGFLTPVDIANRALDHCGQAPLDSVLGFSEPSIRGRLTGRVYEKLRQAELRRNVWRFSIRRTVLEPIDTSTMVLMPALWLVGTTYFNGSIVVDANGQLWISVAASNLGNNPATSNLWQQYFGPMTVTPYDSGKSYFAGELVYTSPGDGTANVYLSQQNANALDPSLPSVWALETTYFKNDVVVIYPAWSNAIAYAQGATIEFTDGNIYTSLVAANLNNAPNVNPAKWQITPVLVLSSQTTLQSSPVIEWDRDQTYFLGDFIMFNGTEYISIAANNTGNLPGAAPTFWVALTGATPYMSLVDLNVGNNPASSPTKWTSTFVLGPGNPQWLQVGGSTAPAGVSLSRLELIYPIGAGPSSQMSTRNIFRLPGSYLREAPQDPKAGANSFLGSPSGLAYTDWEYEGNYIVTRTADPIVYRFVADVADVTLMDPMFCEGLGARIALEICEPLTQSSDKLKTIAAEYDKFMTEARIVNGIETGAVEPAMDDYLLCRL